MRHKIKVIGKSRIFSCQKASRIIGDLQNTRRMDSPTLWLVSAVKQALKKAGVQELPDDAAVVVATQFGPMGSTKLFLEGIKQQSVLQASPFIFPSTVIHMATGTISLYFGIKGPVLTLIGDYQEALSYAKELIENNKASLVITGYVDDAKGILPRVKVINGATAVIVKRI
jgi:3-oxoacyl-(acyl-carrier-protein) synthase